MSQRVPEGLGSQISLHLAHEGGEVVSLTHRPPLPHGNVPGTHFPYGLSRPQGHGMTTVLSNSHAFHCFTAAGFVILLSSVSQLEYMKFSSPSNITANRVECSIFVYGYSEQIL